jgi:dTDP-4-amino-4,6-dideoxygalactose transaminase
VPFVDLKAQYLSIKEDIDKAIQDVIEQSAFIGGTAIKQFESAFASYVGLKHCIACGNGTDSIEILLKAMGIAQVMK